MKFSLSSLSSSKLLKYQLIILVGILVIVAGVLIYHLVELSQTSSTKSAQLLVIRHFDDQNENPQNLITRKIDGQPVEDGKENLYPVAVSIDNHFDSWPNYGLQKASIVYETLVEGDTTRFLAIYTPDKNAQNEIQKIGPVRSTRPYFLELTKEYNALHAHSGGSPEALQKIEEFKINNLEEIAWWGPDYFWRVYSRTAPHNLFTSEKKLAQAVIDWELANIIPDYRAWRFDPQLNSITSSSNSTQNITIDFSLGQTYDVSYQFSTTTQNYLRFQAGNPHLDALTNQQIQLNNLVIQFIPREKILDTAGRIELNLIGKGDALIFRNAQKVKATWRKRTLDSRTIFYDQSGDEIKFKPGNIWIEIVPGDRQVSVD